MATLPDAFAILIYLIPGVIGLAFLLALCPIAIWEFCRQKLQWHKKRARPVKTVQVTVLAKEFRSNSQRHASPFYTKQLTVYTITFETQAGEQLELKAPGKLYGLLVENDFGELTYQDSRCLAFELQKRPTEQELPH